MHYSKEPNLDIIIDREQKAVKISFNTNITIIAACMPMGCDDLSSRWKSCWCEQCAPEAA